MNIPSSKSCFCKDCIHEPISHRGSQSSDSSFFGKQSDISEDVSVLSKVAGEPTSDLPTASKTIKFDDNPKFEAEV